MGNKSTGFAKPHAGGYSRFVSSRIEDDQKSVTTSILSMELARIIGISEVEH